MASTPAADLFNVNGIVALVTGGGSGLGAVMAKALASNGAAKVYIIGRRKESLEKTASFVSTDVIIPITGDVTSKESLESIATQIRSETGYLNLVVANAGIMGGTTPKPVANIGDFVKEAWKTGEEDFVSAYRVNVAGIYFTTLAFLELLDAGNKRENRPNHVSSQVVFTSSIAGFVRQKGYPGFAYASSKAAATHLTKMFSSELQDYNIRANAIVPGMFHSEAADAVIESMTKEDGTVDRSFIPCGRVGQEEEMAGAILHLASAAGGYCNGSLQLLDGGRLGSIPSTY